MLCSIPAAALPPGDLAVNIFYDYETTWSETSLKRRKALFEAAGLKVPQVSFYK